MYQKLPGLSSRTHFSKCIYGGPENTLIPRMHQHVKKWRRYVDDTFAYVKNESIVYVLTLNSFHPNISFTCDKENNNQLQFLDVLLIRNETHLDTAVY